MSTEHATAKASHDTHAGLSEKGLKAGSVGLIGAVVIGVSCIAPAYTLTAALGPTVSEVGVHLPAIFLVGFIPMLLVAFGYRELNNAMPDAGTSFTWAIAGLRSVDRLDGRLGTDRGDHHRALQPRGRRRGLLLPDAGADLRQPGAGRPDPEPAAEHRHHAGVHRAGLLDLLPRHGNHQERAVRAGRRSSCFVLGWFAVAAFSHVANGTAFDATAISPDWFNPFAVESFSAFAAGVSLSIFIYWGWDVTLTMNEETKNPEKTPGRAATVTVAGHRDHLHDRRAGHPGVRRRRRGRPGRREPGQPGQHLRRPRRAGHGPVRDPDVAGHPEQLGRVPAVDLRLTGPDAAGDGPLQGAADQVRPDQPHVQVPELRHDRLGHCRRRVLRHHPDHLRERPVGHHHRARHDDLLLLRHHRPGLRLVLPERGLQRGAGVLLQVPGPAPGRRHPAGDVLQDRLRLAWTRTTAPAHPSAASAWCSSWAWASSCWAWSSCWSCTRSARSSSRARSCRRHIRPSPRGPGRSPTRRPLESKHTYQ